MTSLRLAVIALVLSSVAVGDEKPVDFAHEVVPILKTHCGKCHTNGTYKGSISFDTRADIIKKAVVPGKSATSKLITRVTSKDPDERMPPEGKPLDEKQ